jgi:hypothetical protein
LESLALHQAGVVIGDAVEPTNGIVLISTFLASSVVDKTGSVADEFLPFALENATVLIGLLVGCADGFVVLWAGDAVVLNRAFSVAFPGDSLAFPEALILIGDAIVAAFRLVELRAVITVGVVVVAEAIVVLPDSLAV